MGDQQDPDAMLLAYGLAPGPSWGPLSCSQQGHAAAECHPDSWTAEPCGRRGHQTLTHTTNIYRAPTVCSQRALSLSVQVSQLLAFYLSGRAGHPEKLCLSGGQGHRWPWPGLCGLAWEWAPCRRGVVCPLLAFAEGLLSAGRFWLPWLRYPSRSPAR